jgi:hypothetical protein
LAELAAYVDAHGDALVPQKYVTPSCNTISSAA